MMFRNERIMIVNSFKQRAQMDVDHPCKLAREEVSDRFPMSASLGVEGQL